MESSKNENDQEEIVSPFKVWLLLGLLTLLCALAVTAIYLSYFKKSAAPKIPGAMKASNLEEFLKNEPDLLSSEKADFIGLKSKELSLPLEPKEKNFKIFMVPKMLAGGDAIYSLVGEIENEFFLIDEGNRSGLWNIKNEKEALLYLDFMLVKAGETSYNRARSTVWAEQDYERIGCKSAITEENLPLPKERPKSQAVRSDKGEFLIDWIYSSTAFPAGYHLEQYSVSPTGEINLIKKSEKPFWSCGQGVLF